MGEGIEIRGEMIGGYDMDKRMGDEVPQQDASEEPCEAQQYFVPYFDCPECGLPNDGAGQDDLTGEQECYACGAKVKVVS